MRRLQNPERIIEEFKKDPCTVQELAKRCDCSHSCAWKYLKKAGLKPYGGFRPPTKLDPRKICDEYLKSNESIRVFCKRIRVHKDTLRKYLKLYNITPRRYGKGRGIQQQIQKMYDMGYKVSYISKKLNIPQSTLFLYIKKARKTLLTRKEKEEIRALRSCSFTIKEISLRVKRGLSTIRRVLGAQKRYVGTKNPKLDVEIRRRLEELA